MSGSANASSSKIHQSKATWEDDAWKIDSDDDEFVKASRAGSTTTATTANGGHKAKKSGSARHAPPARPHPYPTSAEEGRNSSREGSSIPKVRVTSTERPSISSSNTATQSGWTLIERTGSGGVASASPSGAAEAVEAESQDQTGSSEAKGARRGSETAAKLMVASIESDLDEVLRDPTHMLARLSLLSRPNRATSSRASSIYESDQSIGAAAASTRASGFASSNGQDIDAVVASVTGDGALTTIPVKHADRLPAGQTDEVVTLPEGMLDRKSSIRTERRRTKFIECLNEEVVQMDKLRSLAWAGMPDEMRPMIWMLLLGYLPPAKSARASTLSRKRAEYQAGVRLAFQRGSESLDQAIWHQIHIDVPRTNPGIALWQREATQRALERILYVWAIRHPASGYVQGINDLATPFFQVFLSAYISSDVEQYDVALLPPPALEALEADTFWCLSKLLDGIQDNYIFAQPGIQRQVRRMGELVGRINRE